MNTTIPTNGGCRQTHQTSPIDSPDRFILTLWTADPEEARAADAAGIQRVGVDLERLGKTERQAGLGTWISPHSPDDLVAVGGVLSHARLFARVNPLHAHSRREIDGVLAAGATVVMAPMIGSAQDATEFAGLVGGRATSIALIESRAGLDHLASIAAVNRIDEIHVGLNDLALSLHLTNRWAALAGDLMTDVAACVRDAGKPFGFGGIGQAHADLFPVPSDLVYAEYARTGATRALIARSFGVSAATLGADVARALSRLAEWRAETPEALAAAHAELGRRVGGAASW